MKIPSNSTGIDVHPFQFVKIECKNELKAKSFHGFDALIYPPSQFENSTKEKAAFWDENFKQYNKTLPPSVLIIGTKTCKVT
jgi:hypothetical protein